MRPTIAIGDVHGLTFWKKAVEESEGKRIVFLGDYLDPYQYISDRELLENLEEIIRLKMERPEQVILLLGNLICTIFRNWPDAVGVITCQ